MKRCGSLVSIAFFAALLAASAAAQQPPSFEVASVKRNLADRGPLPSVIWQPGGQMRATGLTLKDLVRSAYVHDGIQLLGQIVGGPDWVSTDRFDIVAKSRVVPDANPSKTNQLRATMLKGLLADRFKLKVHTETRALPVFDLVLASEDGKLGPQLTVSTCTRAAALRDGAATDNSRPCVPSRMIGMDPAKRMTMGFEGLTMSEFAAALVSFPDIGRPIRDRTGLTGTFDVQLTMPMGQGRGLVGGPPNPGALIDTGILTAIQEQLGLKLEGRRDQVNVIVIDSVEPPTED
jgi:uncharacterized protein (TIGR03435 family)